MNDTQANKVRETEAELLAKGPLHKTKLMCRVYSNDGQPIVSKLAEKFPMLSRSERRMLLKEMKRALKKASRKQQREKTAVA